MAVGCTMQAHLYWEASESNAAEHGFWAQNTWVESLCYLLLTGDGEVGGPGDLHM